MPLKYFDCPDKQRRPIAECYQHCPRPEGRCLSLPTLIDIGKERPWTGTPSVTQLINGTRLEYLKIVHDYATTPLERAFMLLGTRHHQRLDRVAQKLNVLSEEKLEGEITGILDLLTVDELIGTESYELWDYKCVGSYKVAKALGVVSKKIPSTEVYRSSGKWGNKGDPKRITVFQADPEAVDMWEWILQLNAYRVKLESIGFRVSRMKIQATVRDGGTMAAESRGITENIYLIPIPVLPDDFVQNKLKVQKKALLFYLERREVPPECNSQESWEGRRCQGFCDVREFCKDVKNG